MAEEASQAQQPRSSPLQPGIQKALSISHFKQGLHAEVALAPTPEEDPVLASNRLGKAMSAKNFQEGLLLEMMASEQAAQVEAAVPDAELTSVMRVSRCALLIGAGDCQFAQGKGVHLCSANHGIRSTPQVACCMAGMRLSPHGSLCQMHLRYQGGSLTVA